VGEGSTAHNFQKGGVRERGEIEEEEGGGGGEERRERGGDKDRRRATSPIAHDIS
jgi:hypothetical protein